MLIDFISWVNNCIMQIYVIKNKMKTIKKKQKKETTILRSTKEYPKPWRSQWDEEAEFQDRLKRFRRV